MHINPKCFVFYMVWWCNFCAIQQYDKIHFIQHVVYSAVHSTRRGFESNWCQNLCDASCAPGQGTNSNCSVVRRSRKAVGPVYMYLNINTSVHDKERHRLFEKSRAARGSCTSKIHSSTLLGSRVWGKGDCGPFESPLRRSNLGLLQSIHPIQIQIQFDFIIF